jgi:serine/threonine protein kinase
MPLNIRPKVKITDFRFGKKLGKGKFGDVYLVQDIRTNFICAMKIIKKKVLID